MYVPTKFMYSFVVRNTYQRSMHYALTLNKFLNHIITKKNNKNV